MNSLFKPPLTDSSNLNLLGATRADYRSPLNQRSSMFASTSPSQHNESVALRKTRSPTMVGGQQPRLSSNTSHISLSSSGGVRLKLGSSHARGPATRSRFDDPLYRAKQLKKQRKQDIQKRFTDAAHQGTHKGKTSRSHDEYQAAQCHFTFIFDPNGRLSYWMGFIVSLAFLYNFWVMIYRYSFNEINARNKFYWFSFDYLADFLYICDILFNFRTGFLEEGVLQTDPVRLRHYYMNTTRFYIDCLCLMPLDILYLSIGYNSILRCFRLVKIYRFWEFLDRTERHTNFPNFFRTLVMLHYLFAIFHWNACFSYFLSRYLSEDFIFKSSSSSSHGGHISAAGAATPPSQPAVTPPTTAAAAASLPPHSFFFGPNLNNEFVHTFPTATRLASSSSFDDSSRRYKFNSHQDLLREYLKAFYMSTKIMTLVSDLPSPKTSRDYLFAIVQLVIALLLFATIMGHVGYIVSNLGNARKDFQSKLDGVKTYMSLRRVPKRLQDRVIRWFDFLWSHHKSIDDNHILGLLPYKLRAEIAIHVHLDTLKRVEIFQNTEAGFLNELVLRLKPVLYSPGDFICRKDFLKYIVSAGKLQVISDDGKSVLATLRAGSYFGEISILNMGASGNRRTASVKSVGYSDLFCLSKEDLWEVLKEYPAVRVKLEAIAVRRLEKHKLPLTEIVNMKRCKSAPGLLYISQANPPVNKNLRRYATLPATLLKRTDVSLIMSSPYGASTNNIRRRTKALSSTPLPNKSILGEGCPSPTAAVSTVNENIEVHELSGLGETARQPSSSSIYSSSKQAESGDVMSDDMSSIMSRMRESSLAGATQLGGSSGGGGGVMPPSYNERLLLGEIEKLKKFVYYLKAENLTLNFRLNKYRLYKGDLDLDMDMAKAKPENSDIDDFKV